MRRTVDRVEAWAALAILVTLIVVGPALTWQVGWHVYHRGSLVEQAEQSQRFRTEGVLVGDATTNADYFGDVTLTGATGIARWTARTGAVHSGSVPVGIGALAGTRVILWTDANGAAVDAPRGHGRTVGNAILAGVLAAVATTVVFGLARLALRHILDRYRLAAWQIEWSAVEPQWTGRR